MVSPELSPRRLADLPRWQGPRLDGAKPTLMVGSHSATASLDREKCGREAARPFVRLLLDDGEVAEPNLFEQRFAQQ